MTFPITSTPLTTPAIFPSAPILIGKHVALEVLAPHHIPSLYESIGRHRSFWLQVHSGPFDNLEEFTSYIHTRIADFAERPRWSIRLNNNDTSSTTTTTSSDSSSNTEPRYIGLLGLESIDLTNRTLEIGPIIYGHALQRTRAGTEVLLLVGNLIFTHCRFRRWEWRCNSLNVASRRAAERYGFVLEGVLRQQQIVRGENRDTCVFSMVDSEWDVSRRVWEGWLDDGNFDEGGGMRVGMGVVRERVVRELKGLEGP